MQVWTLLQIVFNLFAIASFAAMWMRLRRPPQDDPRLSRGLQLLQTKITVLEDLSDRTDTQVKTLTGLLDQKNRMLQNKILEAEQQMMKIDHSMHKSMEVAEIFQDKIPHHEILERQRTVEYVKAARMANSGLSVDEIASSVHLPREQVELIAKFNRDQLMFDENALPEWATKPVENPHASFGIADMDFVNSPELPSHEPDNMARVDMDFKSAVRAARESAANPPSTLMDNRVMHSMQPAVNTVKATAQNLRDRLVSTAEDILRSQVTKDQPFVPGNDRNSTMTLTSAGAFHEQAVVLPPRPAQQMQPTNIVKPGGGTRSSMEQVKKVVFPRLDK